MTASGGLQRPAALPSLGEMLTRFVRRQAACGAEVTDEISEVVPQKPSGLLGPDAGTVLADALEAGALLAGRDASFKTAGFRPPADWSSLVRQQESAVAIPFCVGDYPQLVRDAAPLLRSM